MLASNCHQNLWCLHVSGYQMCNWVMYNLYNHTLKVTETTLVNVLGNFMVWDMMGEFFEHVLCDMGTEGLELGQWLVCSF